MKLIKKKDAESKSKMEQEEFKRYIERRVLKKLEETKK